MSKNPTRKGFYNYLDNIRNTEKDKDAFLKAAKLQRHERQPRLDGEAIMTLFLSGIAFLSIFGIFAMAFLKG